MASVFLPNLWTIESGATHAAVLNIILTLGGKPIYLQSVWSWINIVVTEMPLTVIFG